MKLFSCDACGHTLYFDNVECTCCGHRLGFDPARLDLVAFDLAANGDWQSTKTTGRNPGFRSCANDAEHTACAIISISCSSFTGSSKTSASHKRKHDLKRIDRRE